MKEAVIIKSYQNGLHLIMDPELEFEKILEVLAFKLEKSKGFFGNAEVALTVSGRNLSDAQEITLVDTITRHSKLNIICMMNKDETTNKTYIKAIQKILDLIPKTDQGILVENSLKNGASVKSKNNIVILGNVCQGCKVVSEKSIIVMGALNGEAYAGSEEHPEAVVAALEMEPEILSVGNFKYKFPKKGILGNKPKSQPKIAFLDGGTVVMEPLTKENFHI